MDRMDFLEKMKVKGKITQEQINKVKAKDEAKKKYKTDKAKMTKPELVALLDILVE